MNLTISPIKFNDLASISRQKENRNNNLYGEIKLADLASSLALKNQILFKGSKQNNSERIIAKYNLKIQPQTFNYIAHCKNITNLQYIKYVDKGKEIFALYSRAELHKKYPHKNQGELTDITQKQLTTNENISRISQELFKDSFLDFSNEPNKQQCKKPSEIQVLSKRFYALLGAITVDGKEDGYRNVSEFLDKHVKPVLFPCDLQLNERETVVRFFYKIIQELGYNPSDFKIETRILGSKKECEIFYKNNSLIRIEEKTKKLEKVRTSAIYELLQKIANQEIDLDELEWQERNLQDYTKTNEKRKELLNEFCQKYGLEFKNLDILNKVFLGTASPNFAVIPAYKSYQVLEFIGDGILEFCAHEILSKNFPYAARNFIKQKLASFVKNENLIILSQKLNLDNYLISGMQFKEKHNADIFEALIGAIYLDGGVDGLDNVCKFLDNNFRDEILSA